MDVLVDGSLGDVENFRDLPRRLASRHPSQDFDLPGGERRAFSTRRERFDELPFAVSPRNRHVVTLRDVEPTRRPADEEWVRAQHDHGLPGERAIQLVLVFKKILPMIGGEPERVAAHSHAIKTTGQGTFKLFVPTSGDPLHVKFVALHVPLAAWKKFDPSIPQMPLELRNALR